MTTAVESSITGPVISISPLTAPAITALRPVTSPITTVPRPIFTGPLLLTSPSNLEVLIYISAAEALPDTLPSMVSLFLHSTSPLTLP